MSGKTGSKFTKIMVHAKYICDVFLRYIIAAILLTFFVHLINYTWDSIFLSGFDVTNTRFINLMDVVIWPITTLLAFTVVFASYNGSRAVQGLATRIKNIKAFGSEVSFTESGAQQLKFDVEGSLRAFEDAGLVEYDRAARVRNVEEQLALFVETLSDVSINIGTRGKGIGVDTTKTRVAVHLQDVIFDASLYQLVDYYPKGGGRGRRFSIRYGAIGLAWRKNKSIFWNLPSDQPIETASRLVQDWGMNRAESRHSQKYQFGMCIILRSEDRTARGVVYMDSTETRNIIKARDEAEATSLIEELTEALEKSDTVKNLGKSVAKVYEDVAKSGSFVQIYK